MAWVFQSDQNVELGDMLPLQAGHERLVPLPGGGQLVVDDLGVVAEVAPTVRMVSTPATVERRPTMGTG